MKALMNFQLPPNSAILSASAVAQRKPRRLLLIRVARNAVPQKIVGASQPARQRGQHLESDVRIAIDEREKIFARQFGQPRVLHHRRIGRTSVTIEHRHLAEEISGTEFCQRDVVTVGVGDADAHPAHVDEVHGIARVVIAEDGVRPPIVVDRQKFAQLHRRPLVERREKRNRA